MTSITLHEIALSTLPVGIECGRCIRHALLTADKVGASFGDTRKLDQIGLYCSDCGSRTFSVTRFVRASEAFTFMRNH